MENSRKESNVLSAQNSTEGQFLQQVKECQHHLDCMEKLFFEFQKVPDNEEKQLQKSQSSLNDTDHSPDKNNKLSNSLPDIQMLMQEFEAQVNAKSNFVENDSAISQKESPVNVQVDSVNSDNILLPLTFVIQVPNSIVDLLKRKITDEYFLLSQYSANRILKSKNKTRIVSLFQRLFRKKKSHKSSIINTKVSQNAELLQLFNQRNQEFITNSILNSNTSSSSCKSSAKSSHITEKYSISGNSSGIEVESKSSNFTENPTIIFPITYNFDEKSPTTIKPSLTIQHQIIPQSNSNPYLHSVKVMNDMPVQCSIDSSNTTKKEKESCEKNELETTKKEESQATEILLEKLIKALLKTTERLNSLEVMKTILDNVSEKELKNRKLNQDNKCTKIKNIKPLKSTNHSMQRSIAENRLRESKSLNKNMQKIPRRLSKLSVCSLSGSLTSDEELYKSPFTIKGKNLHKHARCHSPSMLNYLVCQSERDIDQKTHSSGIVKT